MLDARLYRAACAPVLLALVVAAFSLVGRPRPMETTLAPDAFDGPAAFATLQRLAGAFPDRRPGGPGDERLAQVVAGAFRTSFCGRAGGCDAVRVTRARARTIDGSRTLETISATRVGQPGPGIVVIAHRDAAGHSAEAELSGTAALIELAHVFGGRQTRRTLTLVSTSGGSGGAAAAARFAGRLPAEDPRPDAVVVLGDLASRDLRKPWVLPWSSGARLAPVRLRRTAEAAVRVETGGDPGRSRAGAQFARLAFPFSLGEEGPLNAAGVPAVALQASGERGPAAGAAVSAEHLRIFGRAALRTIDALDGGRDLGARPRAEVMTRSLVLPPWPVRLVVGLLLLAPLVAGVDALARVRRRRAPVAVWLRWLAVLALPFVLAAVLARLMGAAGLLAAAPAEAVVAGRIPADGVALAAVALTFVLGCLLVRPAASVLGVHGAGEDGAPAVAVGLTTTLLACAVWVVNPFAAAVLVLPAHAWLLVPSPELRLRRGAAFAAVAAALVPAAIVLAVYAAAVGASAVQLPSSLLLLVAGGHVGPLSLAALCVLGACAAGAGRLALTPVPAGSARPSRSVLGPMGHAGPGALGGTDSAMRLRR